MSFLARLFLLLSLLSPATLWAQTTQPQAPTGTEEAVTVANGQKIGAWNVTCVAVAVGKTDCTLTQRVLRSTDNAFVADIIATRNTEGKTFLAARVPLGVSLPAGFGMRRADSETPDEVMEFVWQVCTREVCEAVLELDADAAEAMSAEDNAMIAAFRPSVQAEPFLFQLSLNGLNEGLAAIGR